MRIAMVQMSNAGSVQLNMEKSLRAIEEAARQHADLELFPEVQLTEFFPQYAGQDVQKYQVSIESEIVHQFSEVCRKNQIMAVPNLYLLENGKPYDASILIDKNGDILGVQKMVHVAQVKRIRNGRPYTQLRRPEFYA